MSKAAFTNNPSPPAALGAGPDLYRGILDSLEAGDSGGTLSPAALPAQMRPRERLFREGQEALSDQELLAILLNTGIKGRSVTALAADLQQRLERENTIPSVKELAAMNGLGTAKAAAIVAMLELGRRRWGSRGCRVRNPADVYPLIRHYADRRQEHFLSLSLNGAHEILETRLVTVGLVNRTIVHPREVFADVIIDRASAIIVAHNHPSGDTKPSHEDNKITLRLCRAADLLGIHFLDHLIFSPDSYYSYRQKGILGND